MGNNALIQNGHGIIWLVVLAYMAIITGAGAYYAKYMDTADAYFKAGNRIPWWAAGISMYMANFTAYTFVAIASLIYMRGLPGLILETGPALAFALGAIVFANRWHRLNLTSPPEYLEARFNAATRQTFSILGILSKLMGNGIRLLSMCKFLESVTGISAEVMIVVTGVTVVAYTILGGLWAVIVTDVLQFIILFLAVIPMLILSVASIFLDSSWSEFVAALPPGFAHFPNTNPEGAFPGVPVAAGAQWGWLMAFWFSYLLDYNGDWGVIQRMCCTPTERDARKAVWLSAALSLPHAFLLLGCCFVARGLWGAAIADPSSVQEAELIYGRIAIHLLPAGLVGVVAAAMFSATMSTLNVSWAIMSTSFVNDVWQRFIRKDAADRELILVGRIAVAVVGFIAMAAALAIAVTETEILALAQSLIALVVTPLLLPLLVGILLPYTHRHGALAGLIATLLFGVLNKVFIHLPFGLEITLSSITCVSVMWGSALFETSASYKARVAEFFARMRRPRPEYKPVSKVPTPLPIVGSFVVLIGALVLLLTLLPQPLEDRIVTLGAAIILVVIGIVMRRTRRGNGNLAPAAASRESE